MSRLSGKYLEVLIAVAVVVGEVAEGLDVVERIQQALTDDYDRPVNDIRILRAYEVHK